MAPGGSSGAVCGEAAAPGGSKVQARARKGSVGSVRRSVVPSGGMCIWSAVGPQRSRGLCEMARKEMAVHLVLQVGYVFVMKLGRLTRARCVPHQNAGWAALGDRGRIEGGANALQLAKALQAKALQQSAPGSHRHTKSQQPARALPEAALQKSAPGSHLLWRSGGSESREKAL